MNAHSAGSLVLLLVGPLALGAPHVGRAGEPSPPEHLDRELCQVALEAVYARHRSAGSAEARARPLPDPAVRARAADAVLKSEALELFWSERISDADLQRELDRMAERSRAPRFLAELFAALGDDPREAAECLARPLLADRLLRAHYARDQRLHGDLRTKALAELAAAGSPAELARTSGAYTEVEWRRGPLRTGHTAPSVLDPDVFDARVRAVGALIRGEGRGIAPGSASSLQEDETRFFAVAVLELDDRHLRLAIVEWRKQPFDSWWQEERERLSFAPRASSFPFRLPQLGPGACSDDTWAPTAELLDPRYWHTSVWTGSEMIVFGGMEAVGNIFGDGARYDPATDTWAPLPTIGAPAPRQAHVAVWTGNEMVVWGGRGDGSGARYDPATDAWATMSAANAPGMRWYASAIWTGTEMIVWGGDDGGLVLNTGGRYDPSSDTWAQMTPAPLAPRSFHAAVWTGSEMVVWGGYNVHIGQMYADGARYDPVDDSWTAVASGSAPNARFYHTAVWTGTEMIVWGGLNFPSYDLSGGRYDPSTDSWAPTSLVDAPSLRWFHAAVWTGSEMIVQGGTPGVAAGARYDPATDTWTPTSALNSANNGQGISAVWTGSEMIVWGGLDDDFVFHFDGGRYDPQLDVWHPTGTMNVPTARGLHSGAWTGAEMMVWGGYSYGYPNTGALYDPATDAWRPTTTLGAPAGRENATAIWTGTEVVLWGGDPDGNPFEPGTGGRYDPATDAWQGTSTANAPTNRYGHTAVWTGIEMIVFGGIGTDTIAKRYRPATDSWTDATPLAAPGARDHHAAVWTGSRMIIWGGFINDGTTPTGGRYDPLTDTWAPTNVPDSPVTRMWPVGVWTGSEMIVWGGHDWLFLGDLGDGARYDPVADSWTPTTLAGAPTPRITQGVWTGRELVLWGGANDSSGGRYDPAADAWRPTTLTAAPPVRWGGRWSTVWTGSEMIVWGGMGPTQSGDAYCAETFERIFADGFESGDASRWSATVP